MKDCFSSIKEYTLTNINGMCVKIINYGATVTSILVPNNKGVLQDICLGYSNLKLYAEAINRPYFGAIIGRCANRISNGRFTLNNKSYKLNMNNNKNHIHGGIVGYDRVIWDVKLIDNGIELVYFSVDGEEGYPGNVKITVIYTLNDENELKIDYHALSDKDTPLNLTSHIYFNLNEEGSDTITDHEVMINADSFTPIDNSLVPTGEIQNVDNTPFDFRKSKVIGKDLFLDNNQLKFANGYDHNWILNKNKNLSFAASVYHESSGRFMKVFTTEPAVQFYTANSLDGSLVGKFGKYYKTRSGFCLETQHYPDSVNHANFPSIILKKNERYSSTTIYSFSVMD